MEFSGLHNDDAILAKGKGRPDSRRSSVRTSRKTSWGMLIQPPSPASSCGLPIDRGENFGTVDLRRSSEICRETGIIHPWNTVEDLAAIGLTFSNEEPPLKSSPDLGRFPLDEADQLSDVVPKHLRQYRFDKWIKTLQKKAVQTRWTTSGDLDFRAPGPDFLNPVGREQAMSKHKKSLSDSSFEFVTAIKSASISIASFSIAPLSRRTALSSKHQRTDRSSRASNAGVRLSEDSASVSKRAIIDEAVYHRSIQRRKVIEEVISTEESYIADIRFLQNVYVTLLASIPTLSQSLRTSINRNLNDIIELHEELLGNLHRVVPHSEYNQTTYARLPTITVERGRLRFRSLEATPTASIDLSALQKVPGVSAEAIVAAGVAKVFGQKMHRFFVYEEYGAKYESMVKDISSTHRTIPQWDVYQKGLEALASSLSSINKQNEHLNKSLTVGDLLVKPIQRVCRYPLMFAELLKQTPVCDCPDSHIEIENVLIRLRETTSEINRATNDPRMKVTMEKTWILQDRLVLSDHAGARSKTALRTLGHIHLCGVLHIAWQTRHSVDGQYMISLLYKDFLVLATVGRSDQIYVIRAVIGLGEVRLEEVDNGRGLQCHTAPFSWKLVFECDHQLYELILSASSPKEELEWRSRLAERACKEQITISDPAFFAALSLDMKPLGVVFGKPGTVARRISIHKATTIGPKSSLCQVIIKNTSISKEVPRSSLSTTINRSQSLLSTNRISVLAPSRSDRARIESLLADVWTRDILPFPGMTGRVRNEQSVRASASSMMRKLSVASITSNFNKRSASMVSLSNTHRIANEKDEVFCTKYPYSQGFESIVRDISSAAGSNSTSTSHLSIIHDENSQFNEKTPPMEDAIHACNPPGTLKRLVTLRGKKSWEPESARVITPPLRASSANSLSNNRTPPAAESPYEGNENQHQRKYNMWTKATGINKIAYTEGIRNFFR